MNIAADGPTQDRATVQFQNWDKPGLVTQGRKLVTDAKNFRTVAGLLKSASDPQAMRNAAMMLETMAGQYEAAAEGKEPRAQALR